MYNLYFLETKWRLEHDYGGYVEGTLKEVITFGEAYWGFTQKEVDIALEEMVKRKHDSAHFGIARSFIYTFDREYEMEETQGGYRYGLH